MFVDGSQLVGALPFDSFFGPDMQLSTTASRFDSSISWLAAMGTDSALTLLEDLGFDAVHDRNQELATALRVALADAGWDPLDLPERQQEHDRQRPDRRLALRATARGTCRTPGRARPYAPGTCGCRCTSTTTRTTSSAC